MEGLEKAISIVKNSEKCKTYPKLLKNKAFPFNRLS